MLVSTDESKDILKTCEELWNKISDLIRSIPNNSDNMIKNIRKLKFNSDDDLPLTKTLEFNNMMIVVRSAFYEDNKYYPQVLFFFDKCLYKL